MPHPLPDMFRRMIPLGLVTAAALMLAGCQPGLTSSKPGDEVTPNAVAGDPIEVTALDDPALPPVESDAAAAPEPDAALAEEPVAETVEPAAGVEPTDDAVAAEAEAPPPVAKSTEALACEKKGGQWSNTGIGTLQTCVFNTRDGGKRCERESDCEGVCLARSGTCSPLKPLMGCNDILQDNGARATVCIE